MGAPGFPFEILEPFDLEGTELRNSLTCPGIDDVIGSAGGGLQNFVNAALHTAGRFLPTSAALGRHAGDASASATPEW